MRKIYIFGMKANGIAWCTFAIVKNLFIYS